MMFIPRFQKITSNIFIFHIIPWQPGCYVSKEVDIAAAANVKTLFGEKALTKHCCNSPFPEKLAVTTTLFFMLDKHLRGIKMSIKSRISPALAFGVALFGVLMPVSIAQANDAKFVSVPSNYVYDTSGRSGRVSLHDYCTKSPDEFPNPIGKNASFRGPCARHDMCYGSSTDKKKCDARLLLDMRSNCKYTYNSFISPTRSACYRTAAIYFAAVVAAP